MMEKDFYYQHLKLGKNFEKEAYQLVKEARNLIGTAKEIRLRNAIGRLYYGILHQLVYWLKKQKNISIKKRERGKIHSIVRKRLKNIDPIAARYLKLLHDLRKEADYEPENYISYGDWNLLF